MKDNSHSAKYLVLIGPKTAQRALLFNDEYRYLSEVIDDDGLMVDGLLGAARACELPRPLRVDGIVPGAQLASATARCFELMERPRRLAGSKRQLTAQTPELSNSL
jgi:hypothetical protein